MNTCRYIVLALVAWCNCSTQNMQGATSVLETTDPVAVAPKPLYRDPVCDGAADPVVIWNPLVKRWWMFYSNRRANLTNAPGVSWVHGTRLGIAESADEGVTWKYVGTADIELPPEFGGEQTTHWAPEVMTAPDGTHHMFLSVVPGIFENWNHPRSIVHLTSTDLRHWDDATPLKLASDRVIDACILRLTNGTWRLWYNNERDRKSIYYADSPDLVSWRDKGKAVGDQSGEGPKVFRWHDAYWMVTDVWRGLAVYRSEDALNWTRQPGQILETPGKGEDDGVIGGHPDVVMIGNRAYLFYFTHPGRRGPDARKDGYEQRRSSIQVVELKFEDGRLTCDRDEPTHIRLVPPSNVMQTGASAANSFPVSIRVDASKSLGELKPVWRFFGADEPNYAYMKNGRKLLGELGELRPDQVYFRAHNLLSSGDGTPALKWGSSGAYREDEQGRPVYDWTILDRMFDAYRENNVRPYAQIGFMPKDLSIKPEPYQHHWTPAAKYDEIYTGWAYPPKDYAKWAELVYQWVQHCVDRYGQAEVEQWYWEVWNEPNIGYWRGTREEFFRLHDYAIDAVRRALPTARVGGPDVAGSGGRFSEAFLEHCLRGTNFATGTVGTPLDFVSFHAKGAPTYTNDHVRMGIAAQLRSVNDGFRIIAGFPELKTKPIVIGECDPEGCAACQGAQLGYRNSTMYSSYTAASFTRIYELAERQGVNLEGVLTWAFTFEDQPLFAGFRQIATGGIDLPVLNVFRMFSKMNGQRIEATSDAAVTLDQMMKAGVRDRPDVSAVASLEGNRLAVLLWHYHDDDVAGPDAAVDLEVAGLRRSFGSARLTHFRIDEDHSNAYTVWKRMRSPTSPTVEELKLLEVAGQLTALEATKQVPIKSETVMLQLNLPRQAVSLLVLELGAGSDGE